MHEEKDLYYSRVNWKRRRVRAHLGLKKKKQRSGIDQIKPMDRLTAACQSTFLGSMCGHNKQISINTFPYRSEQREKKRTLCAPDSQLKQQEPNSLEDNRNLASFFW